MKIQLPFDKNYRISQLFGNPAPMYTNLGLKAHNGIDFACPTGTPIKAVASGKVEFVGQDDKAGKGIYIISELEGQPYRFIYWHLKSFNCEVGDTVEVGQVIGISNNTGMSTGSHLHFGCKPLELVNGIYQDKIHNNSFNGAIDTFEMFTELDIGTYKIMSSPIPYSQFVKKIQELLNKCGFDLITDGKFGKKTEQAIIAFQTKNGLKIDGVCGKATIAKLLSKV